MNTIASTVVVTAPRPKLGRRVAKHVWRSLPSLATVLAGSACWSMVMAASAIVGLWARGWQTPGRIAEVVVVFALGAALAFPFGLFAARFAALGRPAQTAFAAGVLAFSIATIAATAAVFALDYRQYYATWHDETLTVRWVYEFVFTTAGAVVQFAVLGMRLYFPVGFIALVAAGVWFARTVR